MNATKEEAHAKINLFLDVTGRREDGFHSVETVMQTVSLADRLTVSVTPSRRSTATAKIVGGAMLPTDEKNLACRAAFLYLETIGETADVKITLEKNIPIAAGLAGGSSDAAATLRALNRLYRRPLTDKALVSLAARLGSDVPFCVAGGLALCTGRGETVSPLSSSARFFGVIAIGNEHVSTPAAYAALDEKYDNFANPAPQTEKRNRLVVSLSAGTPDLSALYNVFEPAILPLCPKAAAIRDRLLSLGALAAMMSGSGPSVFGLFADETAAVNAKNALSAEGARAVTFVFV